VLVKLDELDPFKRLRAGATTGAADAERIKTNPNPSTDLQSADGVSYGVAKFPWRR